MSGSSDVSVDSDGGSGGNLNNPGLYPEFNFSVPQYPHWLNR